MIAETYRAKSSNAKISVKDNHVLVNGSKFSDNVHPPTPEDIIFMQADETNKLQKIEFVFTDPVHKQNSTFKAYMTNVTNEQECRMAYKAISTMANVARKTHLISAYKLLSGHGGWNDDGDHGLGRFIHRLMTDRGLTDKMIFLTREYGGQHLGQVRFEIIRQLITDIERNENMTTSSPTQPAPYRTRATKIMQQMPRSQGTNEWETVTKAMAIQNKPQEPALYAMPKPQRDKFHIDKQQQAPFNTLSENPDGEEGKSHEDVEEEMDDLDKTLKDVNKDEVDKTSSLGTSEDFNVFIQSAQTDTASGNAGV
jgi:hypothetical protein